MGAKITVDHRIVVAKAQDVVWDYTQDWTRRTELDFSVARAEILSDRPRVIRVSSRGGGSFEVSYKQTDRPRKTSLAMTSFTSFWLRGGGGSWRYDETDGGTTWSQRNTLILRDGFLGSLFAPFFRWILRRATIDGMNRARKILESQVQ
ncbi:MAG: SRPBCC family protein [Polyangiaceae bacterium]